MLDKPPAKADDAKRILTAVLKMFGELAASLEKATLLRISERCNKLFSSESHEIASTAARCYAAVFKAAIAAGTIDAAAEPTAMLTDAPNEISDRRISMYFLPWWDGP